jgi:hypothetical protein
MAVGENEKAILLGECKWSKKPVGVDVLQELEEALPATGLSVNDQHPVFVLFSRGGFTPKLLSAVHSRRDVILVHGLTVIFP